MSTRKLYNALIRTHNITSRKKIVALKKAANSHECYVLLRTSGSPGVMYVEGKLEDNVSSWVSTVQKLRYKDYQLVSRLKSMETDALVASQITKPGVIEVSTLKEFGAIMKERGLFDWWRAAMGYTPRNR